MAKQRQIPVKRNRERAGVFAIENPEGFFWMTKHLERYFEIAKDNGVVLRVVAYFVKKTS